MLATVVILCIIAILAFPSILNLVTKTENELDDKTETLVITSATTYVTMYINDFPKIIDNNYYIYISDLIKEDLLTDNLKENSNLKSDSCVKVNVNSKYQYEYNVELTCSKQKEE
jgi:hypothetical protein